MRSLIARRRQSACDPAPSRWSWRMQRLMLTPAFRLMLRAGLPLAIGFGAGTMWLADESNRQMVRDTVFEARASFEARPEFMVQLMTVDGAGDTLAAEIREVIPQNFPVSSFDLDLPAIRAAISELSPVKSATVRIRPGGVLQVEVEPRRPVVIWRTAEGLSLIDVTGAHVETIPRRMVRPDLPLIAGQGADKRVKEALSLYLAAAPLGSRLRGIVRIGDRRWDIVLDRNQRILLPEEGADEALDRVIAMDGAQDVLARDIRRIDLRLGQRPVVQMTEYATGEWWEIRQVSGQ
ncbi:cell division protein FtsQ/DivIB [uncultured Roseobacter sp.]|uniref:cell division protein FtsQ/DivIB n=1 Tax=uncultured Roseobacter sp. TaxID=114847 RepID=UPI0026195B04|nr:cell division protein FtsQ/DivIB [uncultured Roseobacter sp.]